MQVALFLYFFQGTRSPFLVLKNLEIGDYAFSLKVTDTSGQTSNADVHVFVKPGRMVFLNRSRTTFSNRL